ncbi:hypothetical protein LIER_38643 [Lithospermum erythrorhizon]|uniref:SWIM-type domain-containing protein n=1 Tax=Lithospermum erythrorhizon TaxID=34254 RepID=A0AAV3Q5G2_LITER
MTNHEDYVMISDKQKGLEQVIHEMFPNVAHRNCVQHIYCNFKKAMKKLKDVDEPAHKWLIDHADARDKPIITMLELVRSKIMERIQKRYVAMSRKLGIVCIKIKKILEKVVADSVGYTIIWNGKHGFEVKAHAEQYTVDVAKNWCSCGSWQLSGIPCSHSIPCLLHLRKFAIVIVKECYRKDTFLNIYSNVINPLNGMSLWDKDNAFPLQPPPHVKLAGSDIV